MKQLLFLIILILLTLGFACSKPGENKKAVDNTQMTNQTVTPTSAATPQTTQTESKYTFNLFELVGKTPQEVEIKTGKPRSVTKANNTSLSYDEERQYEVTPIPNPFFLLVRFFKGKTVQFMWAVPPQSGTSEPKEFVEKFGFKVEGLEVKNFPNAKSWKGTIDGIEFDEIKATRGSSNYSVLTIVTKK